ncbi:MAG: DAK2 domain-containing protein [Oscillospiraceae bacterium]|nr:DAK2 domain-containing protein [Oscillospiraceae bacterium]
MITGLMFRDGIISASNNINSNREAVDALNIFPVPDGDTGTNMSMTISAAAKEVEQMPDDSTIADVSKRCASALLRGARGNSGVILSLIFRGFSKAFKGLDSADSKAVAAAFRAGTDAAYKAVMKPTEGTILTVIRKAAEAAEDIAEIEDNPLEVCNAAIQAAKVALQETPELLPVLKKAGVVDAGGQGLVLIFEGIKSVFGKNIILSKTEGETEKSTAAIKESNEEIKYGYCSEFLIAKEENSKEKDPEKLRSYLELIGDCVVVVDDNDIIKVHVHSNCPGTVIQTALKYGQLYNIKIDNMRRQHEENKTEVKSEPKTANPENDYGFVAVCAGDGLTQLFKDLGADTVVSGGQTMNPSTDDILHAVMSTPAKTVFVLPNNKNIIMAAQQAIPLAEDRKIVVIETKTVPQGISAMLAFDETCSEEENLETISETIKATKTGMVTFAARDSEVNGTPIKQGQIMGITEGSIEYVGDDKEQIAFETASKMFEPGVSNIVTLYYGEGTTEDEATKVEELLKEKYGTAVETAVVNGGQPIYYYMISVE